MHGNSNIKFIEIYPSLAAWQIYSTVYRRQILVACLRQPMPYPEQQHQPKMLRLIL